MNNYRYEINAGCFTVINTEKNTVVVLSNFTASIVKEEHYYVNADSEAKIFYHIQGATQGGEALHVIRVSMEDYDRGKWFRIRWGGKAELNDIDGQKNALKHLLRAIFWLSGSIPSETVYEQTGFVIDASGQPMFLFGNGAVTAQGIVSTCHSKLSLYQLPELIEDDKKFDEAIKALFNLLNSSKKDSLLGVIILFLAAIRATISLWIPIQQFIFLIGPKEAFKGQIAEIISSFLGITNQHIPSLSWESPITELESYAHHANYRPVVADGFIYPETSNRKHDFTKKVDEFLRALTTGLPTLRAKNRVPRLESRARLNCLLVTTGTFAPRDLGESLQERGIYIPYKASDINNPVVTEFQALAKDGVFAQMHVAFIQFLFSDYGKKAKLAKKWFEQSKTANKRIFQLDDRAACNMAGLVVGWVFFLKFAVARGVITAAENKGYLKLVRKQLGSLMGKQKVIYSSNPGQLFVNGLSKALKEGKAHLFDSLTGKQPDKILPARVGWGGSVPNGLWIGWRDAKTGEVFIRGDLDTEQLIDLLPEHDQALFSKGVNKFWKDLKADRVLKCPESGRNATRQVLIHAKTNKNYHLKMAIIPTLKSRTRSPKLKPLIKDTTIKM